MNLYVAAPEAKVEITNAEATPAHHLAVTKTAIFVADGTETPLEFGRIQQSSSKIVMGPDHTIKVMMTLPKRLGPTQRNRLEKGDLPIQVAGRIECRETEHKLGRTRFKLFYGGRFGTNTDRVLILGPTENDTT